MWFASFLCLCIPPVILGSPSLLWLSPIDLPTNYEYWICILHSCEWTTLLNRYLLKSPFTLLRDHDVVIVSIAYPQHIGGYTVASTGSDKPLHGLVVLWMRVNRWTEDGKWTSAYEEYISNGWDSSRMTRLKSNEEFVVNRRRIYVP